MNGPQTEWPIILNSNAHIFWPKGAQKCAHPNFSKKRTNAHIFWPKGAQKCAHQKFWLKVHNSISRLKNVFFKSMPSTKIFLKQTLGYKLIFSSLIKVNNLYFQV